MCFRSGVEAGRYDVTIAAVNRTDKRVLAETEFSLTVQSGSGMLKVFQRSFYTATVLKDKFKLVSVESYFRFIRISTTF